MRRVSSRVIAGLLVMDAKVRFDVSTLQGVSRRARLNLGQHIFSSQAGLDKEISVRARPLTVTTLREETPNVK